MPKSTSQCQTIQEVFRTSANIEDGAPPDTSQGVKDVNY